METKRKTALYVSLGIGGGILIIVALVGFMWFLFVGKATSKETIFRYVLEHREKLEELCKEEIDKSWSFNDEGRYMKERLGRDTIVRYVL